jgi:hypothetical protein
MNDRSTRQRGGVRKVFLETTIQLERFLENPERRATIRANLIDKELCTSSYVRMEFQRTLLKDLFYVRSVVASDCKSDDDSKVFLSELMRNLAHFGPEHSGRSVVRSLLVVACVLECLEKLPPIRPVTKAWLLDYLDLQIDAHREDFLEIDLIQEGGGICVAAESNSTHCVLVDFPLGDRRSCHCRQEEAHCRLHAFLARNADTLERVRQAFEQAATGAHSASGRKTAEALGRVFDRQPVDWNTAKGQQNCWPVGDTIIALEAPEDAEIYTTDRHYDVICPVVGRLLYQERALA